MAFEATAIVGVQSGQCLMPAGGSTGSLAPIVLAACDGSAMQTWQFVPGPSGYFVIMNQVNNNNNDDDDYNGDDDDDDDDDDKSGKSKNNKTNNVNGIDNDNDNK